MDTKIYTGLLFVLLLLVYEGHNIYSKNLLVTNYGQSRNCFTLPSRFLSFNSWHKRIRWTALAEELPYEGHLSKELTKPETFHNAWCVPPPSFNICISFASCWLLFSFVEMCLTSATLGPFYFLLRYNCLNLLFEIKCTLLNFNCFLKTRRVTCACMQPGQAPNCICKNSHAILLDGKYYCPQIITLLSAHRPRGEPNIDMIKTSKAFSLRDSTCMRVCVRVCVYAHTSLG